MSKVANYSLLLLFFALIISLNAFLLPKFWISFYLNNFEYYGPFENVRFWHAHEMIFGVFLPFIIFVFTRKNSDYFNSAQKVLPLYFYFATLVFDRFFLALAPPTSIKSIWFSILFNFSFLILIFIIQRFIFDNYKKLKYFFVSTNVFILSSVILYFHWYLILESNQFSNNGELIKSALLRLLKITTLLHFCLKMKKGFIPFLGIIFFVIFAYYLDINIPKVVLVITHLLSVLFLAYYFFGINFWSKLKDISFQNLFSYQYSQAFLWLILALLLDCLGFIFNSPDISILSIHALGLGCLGSLLFSELYQEIAPITVWTGKFSFKKQYTWVSLAIVFLQSGTLLRILLPIINIQIFLSTLHSSTGLWVAAFFISSIHLVKSIRLAKLKKKAPHKCRALSLKINF